MARVVLATGIEQLDSDIARELAASGVDVAGECFYLEGIMPCCLQKQADTAIISPELAGSSSLEEVIITLRRSPLDIRVILLPGPEDMDEPRNLAGSVIGAGVYDIVFSTPSSAGSKVNAREVAGRVLAPATYAEAEALLTSGIGMPQAHPLIVKELEQIDNVLLRAEADMTGSAAVQAVEKGEKRLSFSLDNLLSTIRRIASCQKDTEHEIISEADREPIWGVEETWDPPMGKVDDSDRASFGSAQDISGKNEVIFLSDRVDEDLSCSVEKSSVDSIKEETARNSSFTEKAVKESVSDNGAAEKADAEEESTKNVSLGNTGDDGLLPQDVPIEEAREELILDASLENNEEDMAWNDPGLWEAPGANIPLSEHSDSDQLPKYQPGNPLFRRKNTKRGLTFQARKAMPENGDLRYLPHQLIAVWSPDGWAKSYTAFNLAALAAAKGFDTALVNYDLLCPELDTWFGVKQTGIGNFEDSSAGVMTFGDCLKPELVSRFIKKRAWGIRYLPAGNKLGNICTPDYDTEALEQTLKVVYQRNTGGKPAITVVDAGRSYQNASTMAALRQAAIVLIPTDGSPVISEVTRQQIEELNRLGHSPRFIEVLFSTPGRKVAHFCQERCSVVFDWNTFLIDRSTLKPQCLRVEGRRAWECVLNQLAPIGAGDVFRRF